MLYQEKSLEELRAVIDKYREHQKLTFGSFDKEDFLKRLYDMVEKLRQNRFDSIFESMTTSTLMLIIQNIDNLNSLKEIDEEQAHHLEDENNKNIDQLETQIITKVQQSKGRRKKTSK